MKLRHARLLLFLVLAGLYGFSQLDEYKKKLPGTWVATPSKEGVLFKRAEKFEAENYGMTFYEDGTLTRRSAKGMFDVTWYDHPGKWHFEDSVLVLLYIFDEKQKAQEKVVIKQLDDQYFRFERLEWKEIRE